jgi:hypothetical protein
MTNELDPVVDQWYMHHDKGEMFRIVANDAATGNVEIQYFDGDVEEIERDIWRELDIETAAAPEDWTGPYDDIDLDDLGTTPHPCRSGGMRPQDWRVSLESHRPGAQAWLEPRADVEQDIEEEVRLVWRVIDSVGNVSWPVGLNRLH